MKRSVNSYSLLFSCIRVTDPILSVVRIAHALRMWLRVRCGKLEYESHAKSSDANILCAQTYVGIHEKWWLELSDPNANWKRSTIFKKFSKNTYKITLTILIVLYMHTDGQNVLTGNPNSCDLISNASESATFLCSTYVVCSLFVILFRESPGVP
jgi:hypothetical protein